jgi:hypothetical protein
MAAGLGFKTFATGEVLSAENVNGYLMQGILVFATEAARDAAITVPAEGQFAFTKDNNTTWFYDGAAWVVSGATGDITAVTAGTGISGGGASGDVTVTNSMATAIDAKGDLVPGTGADTFARLAVGANATVLTADSAAATGMKWAAAAGGGGANWSLLNSGGTLLSGTTTTISGISGKSQLQIIIINASATSSAGFQIRFNSDTGSNYQTVNSRSQANSTYSANLMTSESYNNSTNIDVGATSSDAGSKGNIFLSLSGGNASGFKAYAFNGSYDPNGANGQVTRVGGGMYLGTSTISSVSIISSSSFDAGRIYVYGSEG